MLQLEASSRAHQNCLAHYARSVPHFPSRNRLHHTHPAQALGPPLEQHSRASRRTRAFRAWLLCEWTNRRQKLGAASAGGCGRR
eukprot:5075961-Pleurochrysis_carterae.AAC.1